jgi:alkanesulfonate monooxygenase SsuD/methylene tetrahydromethanopterin reductase-like flavin-dependent oxidoreductase (luciferase family)
MDFGIAVVSAPDSWKVAQRAEQLGFTHVWFYDSQVLCADVFVSMALAAANTSRIRLGTGVLVPSNRIAPVTANALASLARLAPGRIDFGVGTGFTARNTMGLPPLPLSELREYVHVVQALLRGETVDWRPAATQERRKVRFLNPEVGMIHLADRIPLHLSAFAPKARALTAEIAEGWMTFVSLLPVALREADEITATCREFGRDPGTLYKTAFTLGCVLSDGEPVDGPRARAQAGPLVAVFYHGAIEGTVKAVLPPAIQALVDEYRAVYEGYEPADARYLQLHKGHLIFVRPEEDRFVTPELLRMATLTGTAEELRERVRVLRDGGFQQLAIQLVHGHESAIEDWARVLEKL